MITPSDLPLTHMHAMPSLFFFQGSVVAGPVTVSAVASSAKEGTGKIPSAKAVGLRAEQESICREHECFGQGCIRTAGAL